MIVAQSVIPLSLSPSVSLRCQSRTLYVNTMKFVTPFSNDNKRSTDKQYTWNNIYLVVR